MTPSIPAALPDRGGEEAAEQTGDSGQSLPRAVLPDFIAAMDDFAAWREHHHVVSVRWDERGLSITMQIPHYEYLTVTLSTGEYREPSDA